MLFSKQNLRNLLPLVFVGLVAGFLGTWLTEVENELWLSSGELQIRNQETTAETAAVAVESPRIWNAVAEEEGYSIDAFLESLDVRAVGGGTVLNVRFASADRLQAARVVDATMESFLEYSQPAIVEAEQEAISAHLETHQGRRFELKSDLAAEEDGRAAERKLRRLNVMTGSIVEAELLRATTNQRYAAALDQQPTILSAAATGHHPSSSNRLFTSLVGGWAGATVVYFLLTVVTGGVGASARRTSDAAVLSPQEFRPLLSGVTRRLTSTPALAVYPEVGSAAQRFVKRCCDLWIALVALLLLSPLFVLLALCVKLTSKGPILFRQERVGLRGTPFRINKFRTMHVKNDDSAHKKYVKQMLAASTGDGDGVGEDLAQEGGIYKLDDPRVTRIGGFLRSYSLDELPQLWNVVRGEMSLIGPRPSLPWEHEIYGNRHQQRVRAKPGCSGLWQVSGHNKLSVPEMLDLDVEYVNDWQIALDFKILLRTPAAILGRGTTR